MRRLTVMTGLLAATAIAVPMGLGAGETLNGVVGPGFTISIRKADGSIVEHLDPGAYTVNVDDRGDMHNLHLQGPGVNRSTDVEAIEKATWDVSFTDGTYTYICDAHPTTMKGSFTVGTVTTNPPPPTPRKTPTLKGTVGPGLKIALRKSSGARVKRLEAGRWKVVVTDRSAKENFHLSGPGVNKRTRRGFTGTVTWTVTFTKGRVYLYFSDAHPSLVKDFFKAT